MTLLWIWYASVLSLTASALLLAVKLSYRTLRWAWRRCRRCRAHHNTVVPGPVMGEWWEATGALTWVLHQRTAPEVVAADLRRLGPAAAGEAAAALTVLAEHAPDVGLAWWAWAVVGNLHAPTVVGR